MVVGDLHGDWGSLNSLINKKRPDIILQTGDFGWWPSMEVRHKVIYEKQSKWILRDIKACKTKIYWCDGNHEEHPLLPQDGEIHEMYEGVYFCSRGSRLTLPDGRVVLFAGGAHSVDKHLRTPGHDWFPEEMISNKDLDRMLCGDRIDIVISHTCPSSFLSGVINKSTMKINDPSRMALEYILDKYRPSFWFFGHWHMTKDGYDRGCRWTCLDYPKHGGRWWIDLK